MTNKLVDGGNIVVSAGYNKAVNGYPLDVYKRQVVDSTSLEWDDPVEKWLPEFKGDDKGKILLRQLLSHTSGVRPYLPEPRVDNYNHLDSAIIEILPLDTVSLLRRLRTGKAAGDVVARTIQPPLCFIK